MATDNANATKETLEATQLRNNVWAVRPKGACGTCGFSPYPWTVAYYKARSAEDAINKHVQKNI